MVHINKIESILKSMTRQQAEQICHSINVNFGIKKGSFIPVASPAHEENHKKWKEIRDELTASMSKMELPWFNLCERFEAINATSYTDIANCIFKNKSKNETNSNIKR